MSPEACLSVQLSLFKLGTMKRWFIYEGLPKVLECNLDSGQSQTSNILATELVDGDTSDGI